ncbi:MAG: hypothetical protein PT119_04635 [Aphanizomenon gracile PMC627.10]|nr:hypothetical protein [Aphanizomenon gracile PMC627.10]
MNQQTYLKKLYSNRFDYKQQKAKMALWKILIEEFLQKHIQEDSVILDIAGGSCEFINQVKAKEKYLIELNPDAKLFADSNVKIFNVNILNVNDEEILSKKYDTIFVSNFFEHLNSKEDLEAIGFKIDVLIPKFLPYSTKGRPSSPKLLKIYLKLTFLWNLLGGQMFIKASKRF